MKKSIGTIITVVFLAVFIIAASKSFHTIKTRQDNATKSRPAQPAMQFVIVKEGLGTRTLPALATLKNWPRSRSCPKPP